MFKQILLPIDIGHESSWTETLPLAVGMCHDWDASLHVLTVVPDFGMSIVGQYFPDDFEKNVARDVLARLKALVAAEVPDDVRVQHIVGEGNAYEVILKIAKKTGVDLIVMASYRPELKDYLLGPNAARVVRHADCSVLVHRG